MPPPDASPPPETEEHPALAAARRAPVGAPWPSEFQAYLDQRMEDIRAGRAVLVPHEGVHAELEARWRAEHPDEPLP